MAREGVRFEHAFSTAPWTLPSHGSMFTGQWPFMFFRGIRAPVEMPTPTLAEALSRAGYRTGGFTASLAFTTRAHGIHEGFAHYEDFSRTLGTALAKSRISRVIPVSNGYATSAELRFDGAETGGHDQTSFLRWLDRDGFRPFFAFLNYFDAHAPYIAPSPFPARFLSPGGESMRSFRSRDREAAPRVPLRPTDTGAPNTTPSSHPWMTRPGGCSPSWHAAVCSTIPLSSSPRTTASSSADMAGVPREHPLRAVLEVPLLIRFPPGVPANQSIPAPVSLRDIPRTVLTLTGVAAESIPGRSLTRFWKPEPASPDSLILAELSTSRGRNLGLHAVVSNGVFYIRAGKDSVELYDLLGDTAQSTSLHGHPARSADLARFRHVTDSLAELTGGGATQPTKSKRKTSREHR